MPVVVNIFKAKQDAYEKAYKNSVISIGNNIKSVLDSQPANDSFKAHILTTMIANLTKLLVQMNYYNSPETVIKNAVNKALEEKGRPCL